MFWRTQDNESRIICSLHQCGYREEIVIGISFDDWHGSDPAMPTGKNHLKLLRYLMS